MNHYTYLLTNKDNGKKYIGVRSCRCIPEEDTEYMSSSKYVKADGVENFDKVILCTFDNRADAELDEKQRLEIVDAKNSEEYYNLVNGAEGFTTQGLTKENSKLMREKALKQKLDWGLNKEAKIATIHHSNRDYSNHEKSLSTSRGTGKSRLKWDDRTEAQKKQAEASRIRMSSGNNPAHSPEAQAKRVATITGRKRPEHSESMKGRVSIGKDGVYKNIKKEKLPMWLEDGWVEATPNRSKPKWEEKVCPHCEKRGRGPNMSRYHFDNCKNKGE